MMNKIIKIALFAGVFTLFGCSGDGSASIRISDASVDVPAVDQPASDIKKIEGAIKDSGSDKDHGSSGSSDSDENLIKACMAAGFSRAECKEMLED
ncbi:MAG: hypothetical protein MJY98_11485 [Fibrobacter sp.]|nr:hypothetical protein [Fibrobacter sp.]